MKEGLLPAGVCPGQEVGGEVRKGETLGMMAALPDGGDTAPLQSGADWLPGQSLSCEPELTGGRGRELQNIPNHKESVCKCGERWVPRGRKSLRTGAGFGRWLRAAARVGTEGHQWWSRGVQCDHAWPSTHTRGAQGCVKALGRAGEGQLER